MSSVNIAGSRELAPYTALVDFTTSRRTTADRWQAASSCMVPMTFISFIAVRPVGPAGLAVTEACTTVSTLALAITLVISGLRMSARTNSARPIRRSRSRGEMAAEEAAHSGDKDDIGRHATPCIGGDASDATRRDSLRQGPGTPH